MGNEKIKITKVWDLIPKFENLSYTLEYLRKKEKNEIKILNEYCGKEDDGVRYDFFLVTLNNKMGIVEVRNSYWENDVARNLKDYIFSEKLSLSEKNFLYNYFYEE